MSTSILTLELAIERLQSIETEIRQPGVRRLAMFGSVLRDDARPDSDVDVRVEFYPGPRASAASWSWPTCSRASWSAACKRGMSFAPPDYFAASWPKRTT